MKQRTKILKFLAFILLFSLALSVTVGAVYIDPVAPCSNSYIKTYSAGITQSGRTVTISFSTTGSGIMSKVGASCIKLYTSDGTLVKTFWSSSYSNMLGSNCNSYSSSVTYTGNSSTSYYAVVTHYAADSSGSGTQHCTTRTT